MFHLEYRAAHIAANVMVHGLPDFLLYYIRLCALKKKRNAYLIPSCIHYLIVMSPFQVMI